MLAMKKTCFEFLIEGHVMDNVIQVVTNKMSTAFTAGLLSFFSNHRFFVAIINRSSKRKIIRLDVCVATSQK